MKKSLVIVTTILSVLTINLVAAQTLPAPPIAMSDVTNFFRDLLSGMYGDDTLAKVLLAMLLTAVLFKPANKLVGEKPGLAFIIAALVSVIGIKYLATYDMIQGIMLPYGALAIAVSAALPFLLVGFIVISSDMPAAIRKILWGMMAGSFILLWWFRWTDIGDLSYIYLGLGIISAAILFFLDSTIVTMYAEATQGRSRASVDVQIAQIQSQLANLYAQYANAAGNHALQHTLTAQIRALEHTRRGLLQMRSHMP